jgi:hypothetical protein
MSKPKPKVTSGRFVKRGEFQLNQQILATPSMLEFVAGEVAVEGGYPRQVAFTMLEFDFTGEARQALLRSLGLLQTAKFRVFPTIIEIDGSSSEGESESGIWVMSEWRAGRSVAQIVEEAKKNGIRPDLTFALYVLKTLCSAVSLLHQCRVSDYRSIHGAISPQTVWIDAAGNVRCRNHFFGLAMAHEQGSSLEEASDVRSLGEVFWNLISNEAWAGSEHAVARKPGDQAWRILEASGILGGPGSPSVRQFSAVVERALSSGMHYATQKYAAHWLARRRLPSPVIRVKPQPEVLRPVIIESFNLKPTPSRSILPWIALIIALVLAGAFGVVWVWSPM